MKKNEAREAREEELVRAGVFSGFLLGAAVTAILGVAVVSTAPDPVQACLDAREGASTGEAPGAPPRP